MATELKKHSTLTNLTLSFIFFNFTTGYLIEPSILILLS